MKDQASHKKSAKKSKFINDKHFKGYQKPKMVEAAQDLLCKEEISEEAFLGAQAILLLNDMI